MYFSGRGVQPKTIIGDDVWIGARSCIKAGIRIGRGAIIGMGSVVLKDVPPYSIVAGTPATVLRSRFSANTDIECHDAMLADPSRVFGDYSR